MRAKLLLAIFWTLQVLGNIATALLFRAEEPLRTLCLISLGITLVSLVGILIGVAVGWKSPFAPMIRISALLAFCLLGLTNSQTANLHRYFFRRDLPALQKSVDEILTTGRSESWTGVAHFVQVTPKTGAPTAISFCITAGRDPLFYTWHAKIQSAPAPSKKKRNLWDNPRWRRFWLAPHWREELMQ